MVDWRKSIAPVTKSASGATAMTPAQKLASNMDKALADWKAGNTDAKRPTIRTVGDNVQFSVRFANVAIKLDGANTEFAAPKKDFEAVFASIKESALAGEFDKELAPLAERTAARGRALSVSRKGAVPKPRATRKTAG